MCVCSPVPLDLCVRACVCVCVRVLRVPQAAYRLYSVHRGYVAAAAAAGAAAWVNQTIRAGTRAAATFHLTSRGRLEGAVRADFSRQVGAEIYVCRNAIKLVQTNPKSFHEFFF